VPSNVASFVALGFLAPAALALAPASSTDVGCEPGPNSVGELAKLEVSGEAVLPGGRVTLEAHPVPNQPGIFFYSSDAAGDRARLPLADGLSCLGSAAQRVNVVPVQARNNRIRLEVDIDDLASADASVFPGAELRFQGWFRDPSHVGNPFNFTTPSRIQVGAPQYDVLQILIDDIGFEFLRSYHDQNKWDGDNPFNVLEDPNGENLYPWTPFLDEFATKSLRFNQFRVNPTCSTTRAALLTGRYAFRNGVGSLIRDDTVGDLGEFGVGAGNDEFTIAEVVSSAGYQTGYVGKWHLALGTDQIALGGQFGLGFPHILDFGNWDYAWSIHANLSNWPYVSPVHVPGVSGSVFPEDDVDQGYYNFQSWANFGSDPFQTPLVNNNYATDQEQQRIAEVINWMETGQPGVPWYVFSSFSAAHTPYGDFPDTSWLSTQEYWPGTTIYGLPVPGGSGPTTAWTGYCAHVEALDNRLEALFDSLGGLDNVLQDTIVMILADNGSPPPIFLSAQRDHEKDIGTVYPNIIGVGAPNNHFKHQPYERGVRVPMFIGGPVVGNPGGVCNATVDAVDVHATIADLAGATISTVVNDGRIQDGISFRGLIEGTIDDYDWIKTVRDWSFVERFAPNGDPADVMPPISNQSSRRRGYTTRIGEDWFKLIRKLGDDGFDYDEFYHLYSGDLPIVANEVDANEMNDLVNDPQYTRVYNIAVQRMEALLATEP